MPKHARRAIAVTSLVAVLTTGLAACGHKSNYGAAPTPTPTPTAAQLGTGNPFADIRTAAAHMPDLADTLAGGIAKSNSPTATPVPSPKSAIVAGDPDSAAAGLRAKLTYLLTEHVYLAGLAIATLYHFGPDAPQVNAASTVMGNNANDVADLIGTVVPNDKATFLQAWQAHVSDFVDYAKGAKIGGSSGDDMKRAADRSLLAYARTEGEFFNKITNGALSASTVQQAFTTHISSLASAVDAMAAGDTSAFRLLKVAGGHMADDAATLAGGMARSANIAGDPASKASTLRADLTGLLTSSLYLTGIAVFTAYSTTGATDSTQYKAAADALDTNSQDLATAIGSVTGSANQARFLSTWRSHIDDFIAYAKADASNDAAGKTTAQNNLQSYTAAAASFFSDATAGALNPATVAAALKDHVTSVEGAIDSFKSAVVDVPVTAPPTFAPSPGAVATGAPTESASPTPTATSKSKKKKSPSPTPEASQTPSPSPTSGDNQSEGPADSRDDGPISLLP